MDYRSSGVDIDAGHDVVRRIRALARETRTPGVLSDLGSFGGLFAIDPSGRDDTVLVASADGVGTKLKVAFLARRHDTVGEDLVNHCVNDILVQGATPLFFLDYLATGRLAPEVAVAVVEGIARGCRANGCALLGGETAEMPGFYADGEYDLAGFIVGRVARSAVIDGRAIAPGDVFVGLSSSGLHTNGYSLARKIAFETLGCSVDTFVDELGTTVGEALLAPHRSYLPALRPLLERRSSAPGGGPLLKGLAHVTGGGITDNLPRILPPGVGARIDTRAWQVPPIFKWLGAGGHVPHDDMYRTFNMGIGMIAACTAADVPVLLGALEADGARVIGEAEAGEPGVGYVR